MNLKKMKLYLGYVVATLGITGLAIGVAWADNEMVPFVQKTGTLSGCIGTYTGYGRMTNSTGLVWITPTNRNTISGTFTDTSGFPSPYVSVTTVVGMTNPTPICGTNSVTFPATYGSRYELSVYVLSPVPPPTNGEPLNLQVTWQTN